ncbi:MAG TPA: zinc-dependent metalloprotease family protein, partial [Roseiflexaceae bacterium]|nr:zinc-dependent metalloprotease family protein [Roseiflexaceae bacterium]
DNVDEILHTSEPSAPVAPQLASGSQLRTYRLAVAASGEYTAALGGTVQLALGGIVTSINRVDGIYEREVAIRLVLVTNNDQIIYTNASGDPYNNDSFDGGANQTNIDKVIGAANYDIGHVFNTGGGGRATRGCVCLNGNKARGVTGRPTPIGDPFDVDYVAHEIGHQFGARHTWNGTQRGCVTDQHSALSAFEPGSGSTIMGYAGICDSDDLQSYSDPYFHGISIDDIVGYTTTGSGNCPNAVGSGNGIPSTNAGSDYTIPTRTPFTLSGSGSDPNGDALTYAWEEFDTGPAGPPNNPNSPPYFRSYSPTPSPSRTFPRLSNILDNTTPKGEILPAVGGTLNFRLTVRDNRAGGGGINHDSAQVTVAGNAGPFLVTAPNSAGTWQVGSQQTVTWDVANTTAAPVNCATVNILLSTDGGMTFPTVLAAGVPNNGSANITVPNIPTAQARVKIVCATSIFFDISNTNLTIIPKADPGGPYTTDEGTALTLNGGNSSASDSYEWDFDGDGLFDDASSANPVFDQVGQDGVYNVAIRVTKNGISAFATTTVTVDNVAPTIAFVPGSLQEGATGTLTGTISDPGWLDPISATIDWGDGTAPEPIEGVLENDRPDATLTFSSTHLFGDNGAFGASICANDDDTSTCTPLALEIANITPTVEISRAETVDINGTPTFLLRSHEDRHFFVHTQDPGSDDLVISWDWSDSGRNPDRSTTYLVNEPNPDPL